MTTSIDAARDEMNAIVDRFRDPSAARVTTRLNVTLGAGQRVDVQMRAHTMVVDEPKGMGGTNEGPNPVELVLAALAACQAITYRVWAAKLGIALDSVIIDAEGDLDLRGYLGVDDDVRPGYEALRLHVRLEGPESRERYAELSDAVDRHCPVLDVATGTVPVERVIVD